uniref:Uncharacterized protein n=1 Tax=Rhodnius prolixus TaxID=13249 RepID=T1IAI8_RHOPR
MSKKAENKFKKDSSTPKRARSSPELTNRVSKRTVVENMSSPKEVTINLETLSALLDKKLAHLATKEDFKELREEYRLIREENKLLKENIEHLKEANSRNEKLLEELDKKARRNNLVFRGVINAFKSTSSYSENVSKFCEELLHVKINVENIHAFALGNQQTSNPPLLLTFSRFHDKLAILAASKNLNNTGFAIHQDLPDTTRKKRMKLLLVRKELSRLSKTLKVSLRSDNLIVEGHLFTWCQMIGLCYKNQDGLQRLREITGLDLSGFISAVAKNSLPGDYFRQQPINTALDPPPVLPSIPIVRSS